MRVGQLADTTGVSIDTLRYYERIGLLPRIRRSRDGGAIVVAAIHEFLRDQIVDHKTDDRVRR